MDVFGEYAQFYDALYQEKDYPGECDHLEKVFARYSDIPVQSILDLGCGTGGHAHLLVQRGYCVTGVDRSEAMLAHARDKISQGTYNTPPPDFQAGDIRTLDLGRTYHAVLAMFAVVCYMNSNEDLLAVFRTARRHLENGGLFYFDGWFGPAVLTQRPSDRYKIVEADKEQIIRFVHPEMHVLQHRVDVHYKVLQIRDQRVASEIDEVHSMRYLFPLEVVHYLGVTGFHVLRLCPFLRLEDELGEQDWNMQVVAQAKEI
ncbi:MAG: methyltransferase domain-containing protein [Anaerolineales bacterium]|nr:methyltransferase domain-containing protein [Anaerolineales bacterium]